MRLGTSKPLKANVRFIAATNSDLEEMVNKGTFRKDLYYRLKWAWLHLPPLRERVEDIPLLVEKFLNDFSKFPGQVRIEEEAISTLMDYDYPGNIRELQAILYSAKNLSRGRPISKKCFSLTDFQKQRGLRRVVPLAEVEKAHIKTAYEQLKQNKALTAKTLGIGLNTLRRKLQAYGIE